MDRNLVAALGFALMFVLLLLRVPIGIAMGISGVLGFGLLSGFAPALNLLANVPLSVLTDYNLSVIPMFILMGAFCSTAGMSRELFDAGLAWVGHRRGGLALASIGACAGFAAINGSSVATAATMTQVALPEMRKAGYDAGLSAGLIAAGGTLGIMIPPSVPLVIYAILTQESIGKLFMAAVLPGVIAMLGYMLVIRAMVAWKPEIGPAGPRAPWPERLRALAAVAPVFGVFAVVIIGIYGGWANPTEAAAIGAAACGVLAVVSGGMRWRGLLDTALGTAQSTAMIFLVLLGADQLNTALAVSQMPAELALWVKDSGLPPLLVMVAILVVYILLGCVMDSLAMILLTIPVFYPVVMGLDFWGLGDTDKSIWFGILALMVVEIGLVHPPVGMNVYVINRIARTVPLTETFKGVMPFLASDFLRIAALLFFPALSLALVHSF